MPMNPMALIQEIDELGLSVRTEMVLKAANITCVGDLVERSEAEMLRIPGFGRDALIEAKEILAQRGLYFGMEVYR